MSVKRVWSLYIIEMPYRVVQECSSLRSFSLLSFIKTNVKDMAALGIFKNKADWKRRGEEHAFIMPFLQLLFRFY